jgi:hypothetical protein
LDCFVLWVIGYGGGEGCVLGVVLEHGRVKFLGERNWKYSEEYLNDAVSVEKMEVDKAPGSDFIKLLGLGSK